MEFGIDKCVMVLIKSLKRETTERNEWPNQESIRTLEENENYGHLNIL